MSWRVRLQRAVCGLLILGLPILAPLIPGLGAIASAELIRMEDLLKPVGTPDPTSLPALLERIDTLSAELEANVDVKCWTSLGQLESFVAGAEFSPRATHLKAEVVVNYLDQIWRRAAKDAAAGGAVSREAFDAATSDAIQIEIEGYKHYRVGFGVHRVEIPYQDVRDYEITVEPLRVLRTLVQRVSASSPERAPLSSQAIESARELAAVLSTVVLKESSAEARKQRHPRVEAADVRAADARLARGAALSAHVAERQNTQLAAPDAEAQGVARRAMHEIITSKITALDSFNTRFSEEKLGTSFDASLRRAERGWAHRPVAPEASELYRREILVQMAREIYLEAARQHPESSPLTGPEMLDTLTRRYPFVQEFFGTTNLFPASNDSTSVWVPEHLGDTFRDSGWHWKALQLAVQSIESSQPDTAPMDLYAMEELSEFLSIYAVALVRAAGSEAEAAEASQVTRELMVTTQALFEANRKRYDADALAAAGESDTKLAEVWEQGSQRARAELAESFVAEAFTDVTASSKIDFQYEESHLIIKHRFPSSQSAVNSQLFGVQRSAGAGPDPRAPVTEIGIAGGGVAVADVDGDGLLDIYLVSGRRDRLYRNVGNLQFEDFTEASGLENGDQGRGAYFVDYDNDGDSDLFVTQVYAPNRLFRNRGDGRFEDVTAQAGLPLRDDRISHSATWFDFDNDGHLDVYIGHFGNWLDKRMPRLHHSRNGDPNELFRNRGDGTFEDISESARADSTGWTHAVSHFDANGDGWQDLYIANDFGADELLINLQGERFLDATPREQRERSLHGMSVGFIDGNGDGIEDVYVSNIAMFSFVSKYINPGDETEVRLSRRTAVGARMVENNAFLVSEQGSFVERQKEFFDRSIEGDGWAWDADFFDFDNDGLEDLYVVNGREPFVAYNLERNVLYRQSGGRFYDVSARSGADIQSNSRGAVAADFDADGDLDIVINNYLAAPTLLRNNLRRNNWAKVTLEGTRSNRSGIGARVSLHTAAGVQRRTVRGGSGFLSSEPTTLSFGLKDAGRIEKIEVQWPSGAHQVVSDLPANEAHLIIEQATSPLAATESGAP